MYAFTYRKAKDVKDAAAVIAKNTDAKLLAGGQSLIAAMKLRLSAPPELVDLGGIAELRGIDDPRRPDAEIATVARFVVENGRPGPKIDSA